MKRGRTIGWLPAVVTLLGLGAVVVSRRRARSRRRVRIAHDVAPSPEPIGPRERPRDHVVVDWEPGPV